MQNGPSSKRRAFLKKSALGAVVLGGAAPVYGRTVERHWLEVVTVPVVIGLATPMRVAVLGDIHYDPLLETDYMREVVATVNGLNPDLVFFTGDFITDSTEHFGELTAVLAEVKAVYGCYAVLGNHDCNDIGGVTRGLREVGIHMLQNSSVPLPGQPGWQITGLISLLLGPQNISALTHSPPDSRHILLAHEPESFDLVNDPRICLQISGHTHGGQVRVPLVGAIMLPKWGKRYDMGLFQKTSKQLYVNRGVGTVGVNVRVNCRPEVTLLELS